MPTFNQPDGALDDPLVWDACTGFAGGQVSNTRANLLATNQLVALTNVDISATGEAVTRRGTVQVGDVVGGGIGAIQGMVFFDTPDAQYLIAAAGARLWRFDGSTWQELGDGTYRAADATRPIVFAQGINNVYITDGLGTLHSWNGTAIKDESTRANPPPIGAQFMVWFTSRLILANLPAQPASTTLPDGLEAQGDAVYFSDLLAGGQWDFALQELRVGGGEGDPIMQLVPWTNFDLLVLKRHSIWVVGCSPVGADPAGSVSNFPVTLLNKRIGCIAPRSAVQVGDDVFFLSDTGVRSVQRSVATEDRAELGESLSYPVRDVIDRINPAAVTTCNATYWNNRYMLALPLDSATAPNYVLIFNTLTETWSGLWTGWQPMEWAVSVVNGQLRLNFGQASGNVLQWLDWVHVEDEVDATFQDNGVPVATSLTTRAFTFNEPINPKTGFQTELEFNGSTATVDAQVVLDDAGPLELATFSTLSAALFLPLTLPFTLPRAGIVRKSFDLQQYGQFRELQYQLSAASGKLVLRTIAASAWVDTLVVQTQ